jgi:hypothetical protein
MKLRSVLILMPLMVALCAPVADAKDRSDKWARKSEKEQEKLRKRNEKERAKQRKHSEQEWRRSTEGHRPQDMNGDGVISRNEWPGNDVSFRELDLDHDGVLTDRDRRLSREGSRGRVYDRDSRQVR